MAKGLKQMATIYQIPTKATCGPMGWARDNNYNPTNSFLYLVHLPQSSINGAPYIPDLTLGLPPFRTAVQVDG